MQITFNTDVLSELDIKILDIVLNEVSDVADAEPAPPVKAAPAPKPVKAPKPEPVVEAEPEDDDLLGAAPTMSDAVAAATNLVSAGHAAKVKEALTTLGVKRVSEVKEEDISVFLAALA